MKQVIFRLEEELDRRMRIALATCGLTRQAVLHGLVLEWIARYDRGEIQIPGTELSSESEDADIAAIVDQARQEADLDKKAAMELAVAETRASREQKAKSSDPRITYADESYRLVFASASASEPHRAKLRAFAIEKWSPERGWVLPDTAEVRAWLEEQGWPG